MTEAPGAIFESIARCAFRSLLRGIDGLLHTPNHIFMEAIFHVRRSIRIPEHALEIGFVLGEEHLRRAFGQQPPLAVTALLCRNHRGAHEIRNARKLRMPVLLSEGPNISKPKRRQEIELRFFRPAIPGRDLDQNIFRRGLGIFHEHIEIAVLIEYARIHELEFLLTLSPLAIFFDELVVREGRLGIFVQVLHVGMRRRRIEVEVILLHVLAMIAFMARQPKQAFLQNMIAPIPKRQREANPLMAVANPPDAVLPPAIRARPCHVVRKIFPRGSARTVILANRSPLPLGEIRPPALPMLGSLVGFLQALFFGCHEVLPRSGPCEGE